MAMSKTLTTPSKLAKRISKMAKALREKHGLSLQQAADRIRCSKAHIWDLESNKSFNPSLSLIERMATAYGISVHSFFVENDTPDMLLSPFALKVASMIDKEMKHV